MPLKEDYPAIILSIAKNINPNLSLPVNDENLIKCAGKFYRAGASPREIRDALITSQSIIDGQFTIEHIKYGSTDIIPTGSREASIFSDYVALSYCQNNSFLPWWDGENNKPDPNYPFPKYIRDILTEGLKINQDKLSTKIAEMEPQINV
jgi:hypothetical protein